MADHLAENSGHTHREIPEQTSPDSLARATKPIAMFTIAGAQVFGRPTKREIDREMDELYGQLEAPPSPTKEDPLNELVQVGLDDEKKLKTRAQAQAQEQQDAMDMAEEIAFFDDEEEVESTEVAAAARDDARMITETPPPMRRDDSSFSPTAVP